MRAYIFLVILAIFISGCIPRYVEQKPKDLTEIKQAEELAIKTQESAVLKQPQVVEKTKDKVIKKEYSKSYKVTMKTKKFAFSDTGFLVKTSDMLRLNVLAMGNPVLDLKIKNTDDICVGSLCNTKHGFNQSFLVGEYPDDMIENVLTSKPIFEGKNLKKTKNGFVQKIETKNYKIKYQISRGNIYFKDKQNKIIIKLKELKE